MTHHPAPYPGPAAPRAHERWTADQVHPVPGTPYAVVHLAVAPVLSGFALGALIAGIGSIVVSVAVGCFGVLGARAGWGGWVAGAFTILGGLTGVGGIGLGVLAVRQIRSSGESGQLRFTGRRMALTGIGCAAAGLLLTFGALLFAVLLQVR
jgi:hypothetical protein